MITFARPWFADTKSSMSGRAVPTYARSGVSTVDEM
jgi:hypothetical protein